MKKRAPKPPASAERSGRLRAVLGAVDQRLGVLHAHTHGKRLLRHWHGLFAEPGVRIARTVPGCQIHRVGVYPHNLRARPGERRKARNATVAKR